MVRARAHGEASIDGNLEDYAFLVLGLVELYEATFETKYLKEALRLQNDMIEHFWDQKNGGFLFTSDQGEKLLVRYREFRDGAIPSGNSVAFLNLIRLARMTGNTQYEEKAAALAKAFSSNLEGTPSRNTMFLSALDFFTGPSYEIVIVGNQSSKETGNILHAMRTKFLPNKAVLLKKANDTSLGSLASFTKNMKAIDNKTTAYICRDFVCNKPATNVDEVMKMLASAQA